MRTLKTNLFKDHILMQMLQLPMDNILQVLPLDHTLTRHNRKVPPLIQEDGHSLLDQTNKTDHNNHLVLIHNHHFARTHNHLLVLIHNHHLVPLDHHFTHTLKETSLYNLIHLDLSQLHVHQTLLAQQLLVDIILYLERKMRCYILHQ